MIKEAMVRRMGVPKACWMCNIDNAQEMLIASMPSEAVSGLYIQHTHHMAAAMQHHSCLSSFAHGTIPVRTFMHVTTLQNNCFYQSR